MNRYDARGQRREFSSLLFRKIQSDDAPKIFGGQEPRSNRESLLRAAGEFLLIVDHPAIAQRG